MDFEDLDDIPGRGLASPDGNGDEDGAPPTAVLAPALSVAEANEIAAETESPEALAPPPPAPTGPEPDGVWMTETAPETSPPFGWPGGLALGIGADLPVGDVDARQILRDRPDVHAAFYREFYSDLNDRNSPAWVDRVGGQTPEDYALYWYKTYGRFEGYQPGSGAAGAPAEGAEGVAATGRTTIDGVPLSRILSDRPDVFQAFFTEYYGAGNDRHSDAWAKRVGGATPEDYADYWYNAHGRLEGYRPDPPPTPPAPEAEGEPPQALTLFDDTPF